MNFLNRQYNDARKHRFAHRYVVSVDDPEEHKPLRTLESALRNNIHSPRRSLAPSITIGTPPEPASPPISEITGGNNLTVPRHPHPHVLQRIPSKAQQVTPGILDDVVGIFFLDLSAHDFPITIDISSHAVIVYKILWKKKFNDSHTLNYCSLLNSLTIRLG